MSKQTSKAKVFYRACSFSLMAASLLGSQTLPAMAVDTADDVGVFGSLTVAKQAREAAKAMNSQDYSTATNLYRQAASTKKDFPLFYYGMLYCASKANLWDQAAVALDGIADRDPADVSHLAYEYGHVYTMQNRFDDAVPKLKDALAHVNIDKNFLTDKIKLLQQKTDEKAKALVPGEKDSNGNVILAPPKDPVAPTVPHVDLVIDSELNPDHNKLGDNYTDAFLKSEFICIAEYKGYEKKDNIGFYIPPTANFKIVKTLIGYSSNKDLPLKFKFYEYDGVKPPDGWKFGPEVMPKPGSRWIIFIPNFVPIKGEGYDTYKGSYGRQPATPENLGEIHKIIEAHHGQG